jgi:N-methylhydantoinase A/oxoprolinase/acetone carboxylase beta subunit
MILGIDVGGTHTDAVLIEKQQIKKREKVITDENNLINSLLNATTAIFRDVNPEKLSRVVLSTTISTNAIVQNKVNPVGMMISPGPGLSPSMFPIKNNTQLLSGYMNHRGIEITHMDSGEVLNACERFSKDHIQHAGIVCKFSTRNPSQELAAYNLAKDHFAHISLGHTMSGHLNFPRRIATTYLNEAVWSKYQLFADQTIHFVKERRLSVPLYILKADGGTFDINHSRNYPVQTILSGPAASIMGILFTADCQEDAIALDIGGTTTDIAIFADGVPLLEHIGVTIGGYKTLIRGLRTKSIPVGGDSRVKYRNGNIHIGPEREGPAFALGGPYPTLTDAMIVLGLTKIGNRNKAEIAMQGVADAMNKTISETADQIYNLACEMIASEVLSVIEEINNEPVYTIHEMLEGKKLEPKMLYVVGGPAESMAQKLAEILKCPYHIPPYAEVANAVGAAVARTTAEITIHADTERRVLSIVEDGVQMSIPQRFSMQEAIRIGKEKLKARAMLMGAGQGDLEMEVIEQQEFNMIREYYTTGKNIRVKLQVKPGLVSDAAKEQ